MHRRTLLLAALASPAAAYGATPLKVVATFGVLGDMVKRIAGDRVALTVLVGIDDDIKTYEPTAEGSRAVGDADLLVVNGLNPGFEPWLDGLLRQAQFHGVKLVASDGVRVLKKADVPGATGVAAADEVDPDAWLDAANGAVYAANIQAALIRLDPAQADAYRASGDAYRAELLELDRWAKERISDVPEAKRTVIVDDGFAYLGRAYGIRTLGAPDFPTDRHATQAEADVLIAQVKRDNVSAIFLDNLDDAKQINLMTALTDVEQGGELFSESLSKPGLNLGAETYVDMFRHDIETLWHGMMRK
jgi:zinc/manganese transport system substrate-binding protein